MLIPTKFRLSQQKLLERRAIVRRRFYDAFEVCGEPW